MAQNGRRLPALDNSQQFNRADMASVFQVDTTLNTQHAIHEENHLGKRRVKLDELVATQDRYNPDKVKSMMTVGRMSGEVQVVFLPDGTKAIHDGHHRAITKAKQRAKTMWVDAYQG